MKKRQIAALEWNQEIIDNPDGTITIKLTGPKDPSYASSPAYTLYPSEVADGGYTVNDGNVYTRTHKDGWTISGCIAEDWFEWVNDFVATKKDGSFVKGNFEYEIQASSVKAVKDFLKNHAPSYWDYWDI